MQLFHATLDRYTMDQQALVCQQYASQERQIHRLYYQYKAQEPEEFMMGCEEFWNERDPYYWANDPYGNYYSARGSFEDLYDTSTMSY